MRGARGPRGGPRGANSTARRPGQFAIHVRRRGLVTGPDNVRGRSGRRGDSSRDLRRVTKYRRDLSPLKQPFTQGALAVFAATRIAGRMSLLLSEEFAGTAIRPGATAERVALGRIMVKFHLIGGRFRDRVLLRLENQIGERRGERWNQAIPTLQERRGVANTRLYALHQCLWGTRGTSPHP
jgi:hypothetical protein